MDLHVTILNKKWRELCSIISDMKFLWGQELPHFMRFMKKTHSKPYKEGIAIVNKPHPGATEQLL
jgi:hypothetical protein